MKLAELLTELPQEQLDRLSTEHVRSDEHLSRASLCAVLEGILRSYRLVQEVVFRRQPPTFSILTALLDAPDHVLSSDALREAVARGVELLCASIASGDLLGREDQLRIYRRVLYEARRSDLQLDQSESAILAVLRRELEIAQVEHFLIEYHADLQEFWKHGDCFEHELHALMSVGIVFAQGANVFLASDTAPLIRQALGIDMGAEPARRLYGALSNPDVADALARIDAKTSGTKEERVERLVFNWVQPRFVLRPLSLDSLRDICREMQAPTSGSKDELLERIIARYATGSDQPPPPQEEPTLAPETPALDEVHFKVLFGALKGAELTRILEAFPHLKQSGTKEARSATLWQACLSEATLLSTLMNRDLEDVLFRCDLKSSGSKAERIQRLIDHFAGVSADAVQLDPDEPPPTSGGDSGPLVDGAALEE